MIGMRAPQPRLFEIAMSTEDVMDQTVLIAGSLGLRWSITSPGFDLDVVDDLNGLWALSSAQLVDLCPRTVESISALRLDSVL